MTAQAGSASNQTTLLTRLFVARFFENDVMAGSGDLRTSFFWLLAFLAPIGILMPWTRSLQYTCYYLVSGPEALGFLSLEDKAFYLGLGMVAAGVVGVITWPSFLLDRRDVLVLGAMPVPWKVIVRAKLLAVLAYGGLLAAGMHAGASVAFGLLLSDGRPFTFLVRAVLGHFVASCLASLFVLLAIVAAQAILAAVAGGRLFARISPLLQVGTAVAVLGMLIALPTISSAALYADERWALPSMRRAVRACAPGMRQQLASGVSTVRPWGDFTPVAWFTGVYEWMLGVNVASVATLAFTATVWTVVTALAAVLAYPAAARRMMRWAVEGTGEVHPAGIGTWVAARAARVLTRVPARRAAVQFLLATAWRVSTHRFVIALGAGATVALALPALMACARALAASADPPAVALLSLPLTILIGALVTLRVVASLPAELGAAWVFALTGGPKGQARAALWRVMWTFGIAPAVVSGGLVVWAYWGASLALTHGLLCAAVGGLLVEGLLWHVSSVPCTRPWQPSDANLRAWWPAYIGGFLLLTQGAPRLSLQIHDSTSGLAVTASVLLLAYGVLRRASVAIDPSFETDELLAPHVLDLQ